MVTSLPELSRLIRYRIDILCVAIVVATLSLQIACVVLRWPVYLLIPVLVLIRQVHLVEHNHAHLYVFRSPGLNNLLGWMCFLSNGVPLEFYEVHHVHNHHRYELRFEGEDQDWSSPFGFSGTHFPDRPVGKLYYMLTFPVLTTCHCLIALLRSPNSKRLRRFWVSSFVVSASVALLVITNWRGALIFIGVPWLVVLASLGRNNYAHHHQCDMSTPYDSANVNLRFYSRLLGFNIGYHVAHHIRPGAHWTELPRHHASIADKIPASRYARPLTLSLFRRR